MKTVYKVQQAFGDKLSGLRLAPGQSIVHSDMANVVEFLDANGSALTSELHGHPVTDPPFFADYFAEEVKAGNLSVDAPAKPALKADAPKPAAPATATAQVAAQPAAAPAPPPPDAPKKNGK